MKWSVSYLLKGQVWVKSQLQQTSFNQFLFSYQKKKKKTHRTKSYMTINMVFLHNIAKEDQEPAIQSS